MSTARGLPAAVLALALAVLAWAQVASPSSPPTLPDADYPRLAEASQRVIEAALAGEPNRRAADKARVAALMLAEYAQQNLSAADAAERATLRDAALRLADLVKEKQFAEARQLLQQLPKLAPNPKAKLAKVKLLGPHLDIEELMSQFRSPKLGGLGMESRLDELAATTEKSLPAAVLDEDLRLLALRSTVAAELSRDHLPPQGKREEWLGFAEQMRRLGLELADAVKARDGKAALATVHRLNDTCNKCHLKFRQ